MFEGGLGVLAVIAGWLLGHSPWESLKDRTGIELAAGCGWGVLATMPMVVVLVGLNRWPVGPFAELKRFVHQQLVPMFAGLSLCELGLLSVAAGVGEELLFRGLLQSGIADWVGSPYGWLVGLAVASILFGVCHWLSTLYALLATVVAVYLGVLFLTTQDLLVPIVAHALYDLIALIYLVHGRPQQRR